MMNKVWCQDEIDRASRHLRRGKTVTVRFESGLVEVNYTGEGDVERMAQDVRRAAYDDFFDLICRRA